jgi:prephenate dehydratase
MAKISTVRELKRHLRNGACLRKNLYGFYVEHYCSCEDVTQKAVLEFIKQKNTTFKLHGVYE